MTQTIKETIKQLHSSLRDYIEATYHISAPALIEQRKELLDRPGVIHQIPYIESTPRYQSGESFSAIKGLPPAAALKPTRSSPYLRGNFPALIYDPPYKHQSDAIRHSLVDGKNLLVMTGTGSGKTESFLLPILGKLAREAMPIHRPFATNLPFEHSILYPMNALVNDQLGRLRSLFGDPRIVRLFNQWARSSATFCPVHKPHALRGHSDSRQRLPKAASPSTSSMSKFSAEPQGPASEEQAASAEPC